MPTWFRHTQILFTNLLESLNTWTGTLDLGLGDDITDGIQSTLEIFADDLNFIESYGIRVMQTLYTAGFKVYF